MSVTLAMLVLDPPLDRLAALIEFVRPVVQDVVIVVDDRTAPETLEPMSTWRDVTLVPFRWVDDFAAARNAALPHATGDWVLHLDPDELPSLGMLDFIRSVDTGEWVDREWSGFVAFAPRGWLFWTVAYTNGYWAQTVEHDWHCRLFRREHGQWYKPVHEQVALDGRPEYVTRGSPILPKAPAGAYLIHSKYHSDVSQETYMRIDAKVAAS